MNDSIWPATRSALFRPGDEAWNAIAAYAGPLARHIARRHGWLAASDREDLVQDVLIAMKESLAASHDPNRGRFRALLQTVVRRRVADRLRRRRVEPLDGPTADSLAARDDEAIDSIDLDVALVEALASCRDRFTQGPARDPEVLLALADRIVNARTNAEIAARSGVSKDRVARLLERGRGAIFTALLGRELAFSAEDPRLDRAVAAFQECLRRPTESLRVLDAIGDASLREALEGLLARLRAALPHFEGDGTVRGEELRRGLALVLGDFAEP